MANPNMRKGARSVNPNGRAGKPKTQPLDIAPGQTVVRTDAGWMNTLTGFGVDGRDNRLATTFCSDTVPIQTARELWRGDDLAGKVIEKLPDAMIRQGYFIKIAGGKVPVPKPQPPDPAEVMAAAAPVAKGPPRTDSAIGIGTRVRVKKGKAHDEMTADVEGEVVEIGSVAFGVRFRGMKGVHHWYTAEELEIARTDADAPYPAAEPAPPDEGPSDRVAAEDDAKDVQEQVGAKLEELDVDEAFWQALCFARAYGAGYVLLGVDDGGTLETELDLEKVVDFHYVTALEPDECQPLYWYSDPLAPKFGKPSHYTISPTNPGASKDATVNRSGITVHESRVIRFDGVRTSRRQTNAYGTDDSVFTRVIRVLRDFNMSWNAVSCLVNDFAVAIYKLKGLAEMIGLDGGTAKFRGRMQGIELSKSVLRGVMLDAEGEDYERKSTTLSGLPEILNEFKSRFAAAADMPVTLCFGVSPAGMNATGESDVRAWYDTAKALQKRKLKSPLEQVIRIVMAALKIDEPEKWCVEFHPLWQPTEKEIAETRKIVADTDSIYITAGVVTPEEVGASRWGGDGYSMEMSVDFSAAAMEEREANRAAEAEMKMQALEKAKPPPQDMVAGVAPQQAKNDAFSDDQPRDETGKWTSEGGGGGHSGRAKDDNERAARTAAHREKANRAGAAEHKRLAAAGNPNAEQHGLDEAKNTFDELEARGASKDETFNAIDKLQAAGHVKAPPSKAHEALKTEAGNTAKLIEQHMRPALEKVAQANQQLREVTALAGAATESDSAEEEEDLVFDIRDIADETGLDEDAVTAYANTLGVARELSHYSRGTVPRDGEALRVAEEASAMALPQGGDEDAPDVQGDIYDVRDRLPALAASLDEAITAHETATNALKGAGKSLEKAFDRSDAELEIDPADLVTGLDGDAHDDAVEAVDSALGFEKEERAFSSDLDSLDDHLREAKRLGTSLKSARKAVAHMQKKLADLGPRPRKEKSLKYTQGRTGLDEAKARLAARKAAGE